MAYSGAKVTLVLRPARPDTGIVFRRVDLVPPVDLKADPFVVGDTRMASCLEKDGVKLGTVEHLMSALAGLGIDNLYIDVDAAEIPIMVARWSSEGRTADSLTEGEMLSLASKHLMPTIEETVNRRALKWATESLRIEVATFGLEASAIGCVACVYQDVLTHPLLDRRSVAQA